MVVCGKAKSIDVHGDSNSIVHWFGVGTLILARGIMGLVARGVGMGVVVAVGWRIMEVGARHLNH